MKPAPRPTNLSSEEIYVISCAFLDLVAMIKAIKTNDISECSIEDCEATVADLESTFPFLTSFEDE